MSTSTDTRRCKIEGRGLTKCLFCGDASGTLLCGNRYVVEGVNYCCGSADYDYLMKFSKLCLRCIGRLQLLVEFMTIFKESNIVDDNDGTCCDFCFRQIPEQLIPSDATQAVSSIVDSCGWTEDFEPNQAFLCCFSCYSNMVQLHIMTSQLKVAEADVIRAMQSWRIPLKRLDDPAEIAVKEEPNDILPLLAIPNDCLQNILQSNSSKKDMNDNEVCDSPKEKASRKRKISKKTRTKLEAATKKRRQMEDDDAGTCAGVWDEKIFRSRVVIEKLNIKPGAMMYDDVEKEPETSRCNEIEATNEKQAQSPKSSKGPKEESLSEKPRKSSKRVYAVEPPVTRRKSMLQNVLKQSDITKAGTNPMAKKKRNAKLQQEPNSKIQKVQSVDVPVSINNDSERLEIPEDALYENLELSEDFVEYSLSPQAEEEEESYAISTEIEFLEQKKVVTFPGSRETSAPEEDQLVNMNIAIEEVSSFEVVEAIMPLDEFLQGDSIIM